MIIQAAQNKLTKYYSTIEKKKKIFFNVDVLLNSCVKLNFYVVNKISYYDVHYDATKFRWI